MWQISQVATQATLQACQLGVCFNYLQPFSVFHTCSKQVCRKCNKLHHTLLHMNRRNQVGNNKGSTSNNLPADSKVSSTVEVNTYCSLKSKPMNHFSCFSSCWIQIISCACLRLSRTKTPAYLQGNSNINTAAWHSVSINLRCRHSGWHTTIDYGVLPNITGTKPCTKLGAKGKVIRRTYWSTIDF